MKIEKLAAAEGMPGYFPPGAVKTEGGFHICTMAEGENVSLAVFETSGGEEKQRIFPFPEGSRLGNMRTIRLLGGDFAGLSYSLICDGTEQLWTRFYGPGDLGRAVPCEKSAEIPL